MLDNKKDQYQGINSEKIKGCICEDNKKGSIYQRKKKVKMRDNICEIINLLTEE